MKEATFIWLFAPNGYVGQSASFEIGYAHALGIPIYTDETLEDEMLQTMVKNAPSISKVPRTVYEPGKGIDGLQKYYKRIALERGWNAESARYTLLLLVEEVGELARAIRKEEKFYRSRTSLSISDPTQE